MTGPQHFREAERLLRAARDGAASSAAVTEMQQAAQVHATLALAAATALGRYEQLPAADRKAWLAAAGPATADGSALREIEAQRKEVA